MSDDALRSHVLELLDGGHAHSTFDAVVEGWPPDLRGAKPGGSAHTPWQVLEHLRIAQRDILEFSRDAKHESPPWPEGYWPSQAEPPSKQAWEDSAADFRRDFAEMRKLVADPAADLFIPFAHGSGQTLLREALLVADHNAFHLGEMIALRRSLGA